MKLQDLKESDKERGVIYTSHDGRRQKGVISSWNDEWIFVRYTSGSTAAATSPHQLEFEHETNARK